MNIFVLDLEPAIAASYHTDRHVVKMILESAQMLCTAVNSTGIEAPYKSTHVNHPCNVWLRESQQNWLWLSNLVFHLNVEWQYRYDHKRDHKSFAAVKDLPTPDLPNIGMTEFAQAMPDHCKHSNPVVAYRQYYAKEKRHLHEWRKVGRPYWLSQYI